jgi:hypothetical protein
VGQNVRSTRYRDNGTPGNGLLVGSVAVAVVAPVQEEGRGPRDDEFIDKLNPDQAASKLSNKQTRLFGSNGLRTTKSIPLSIHLFVSS